MLDFHKVHLHFNISRLMQMAMDWSTMTSSSPRRFTWTRWIERNTSIQHSSTSTRTTVGKLSTTINRSDPWILQFRKSTMSYVLFHKCCSYITKDELEQALKEKGLYDAKEIKDIISEADTDNVRNNNHRLSTHYRYAIRYTVLKLHIYRGL
jgi:hypothetical protein